MKKTFLLILLVLFGTVSITTAASLKVGVKAPDFKLKDTTSKEFSLNVPEWKGKNLLFIAMTIDNSRMNAAVSVEIAKDAGIERRNFAGTAIFAAPSADAFATLKDRQKEKRRIYLIDKDDLITRLWGLQPKSSNVVFLDKGRICRYIYKGKLSAAEIAKLIQTIKTYQSK
jgi:predicted transcriptional regulator